MGRSKFLRYNLAERGTPYEEGFRYVTKIPEDYALLFKWSGPLVMNNCFVPLSAAFLDRSGRIIEIKDMEPEPLSSSPQKCYKSYVEPYIFVIEAPKGTFETMGWGPGDFLDWDDSKIYKRQDDPLEKSGPLVESQEFSVVNLPSRGLDHDIWDVEGGKKNPDMRPEVQRELMSRLFRGIKSSGFSYPEKWIARLFVTGSCTTNQFDKDSDIDVNVIVDINTLRQVEDFDSPLIKHLKDSPNDDIYSHLKDLFYSKISGRPLFTTNHDINYFLSLGSIDLKNFDAVYDLITGEWVKPPFFAPEDFDPEIVFPDVYKDALSIAEEFDIHLGTIKRDSIKLAEIINRLKEAKEEDKAIIKAKINTIVNKLNKEIKDLYRKYKDVADKRRGAYSNDPDQLRAEFMKSKNWVPEVVLYKWLEKWRYLKLARELNRIWNDEDSDLYDKVKEINKKVSFSIFKLSNATQMGMVTNIFNTQNWSDPIDTSDKKALFYSDFAAKIRPAIAKAIFPLQGRNNAPWLALQALLQVIKNYAFENEADIKILESGVGLNETPYVYLDFSGSGVFYLWIDPTELVSRYDSFSINSINMEETSNLKDDKASFMMLASKGVPSGIYDFILKHSPYDSSYLKDFPANVFGQKLCSYLHRKKEFYPRRSSSAVVFFPSDQAKRAVSKNEKKVVVISKIAVNPNTFFVKAGYVLSDAFVSKTGFGVFCYEKKDMVLSKKASTPEEENIRRKVEFISKAINSTGIVGISYKNSGWVGSCFKINENMVVTCHHVLFEGLQPGESADKNYKIKIRFGDSKVSPASLYASNPDLDLAVLVVDGAVSSSSSPLPLVDSKGIRPGYPVYAVGSPEGLESIVTQGIVASTHRSIGDVDQAESFFINLEIHPGSSGGPVLSYEKKGVVGVARGSIGSSENNDWVNYCISSHSLMSWLDSKGIHYLKAD